MSYTAVKYVSFNKKEQKIIVTGADSSLSPRKYVKFQYSNDNMTFEQNIEDFFVDMLNGNLQGGPAKITQICKALRNIEKLLAPNTSHEKDMELDLERDHGLDHLVSRLYAVPLILTGSFGNAEEIALAIKAYDDESVRIYEEAKKRYDEIGWLITGACSRSDVFPGWNVYSLRDKKALLLAEHSCYEKAKNGFCNTRAGRTILIDESLYEGNLFWTLSNGWNRSISDIRDNISEATYCALTAPELWKLFEGLVMAKLPYLDFPYEKYGFKLKEDVA